MKKLLAALFLLLLLAHPSDLSSCGPFLPYAVFTLPYGPDNERTFFAGQLGILQPSYERRYLAMAYRMLNGQPLSKVQMEAVTNLKRYRSANIDKPVKEWLAARNAVPEVPPKTELDPYRPAVNFITYPGCGADAFVTAIQTLHTRIQQAGDRSPEVRDWLQAQDQVFDSCKGSATIPDPAPSGSSERVRADRSYQIAAAAFYSGAFDQARTQWREISSDAQSPWRVWAPYLIARSYLRQDNYKAAEDQLQAILENPAEASIHRQARELLDYPLARTDPAAQLLALSQRLAQPHPVSLAHDLNDYTFLYDQFEQGRQSDFSPNQTPAYRQSSFDQRITQLQSVAAQNDLTAWMVEFQNVWAGRSRDALERWRKTKSLAWLLAAAIQVKPDTQDGSDVIAALAQVPASSPGYASARFSAARMLVYNKQDDQAARLLDEALSASPAPQPFDVSTANALHAERMKVARTFGEFLQHAPRTIAAIQEEDLEQADRLRKTPAQSFDGDATTIFNDDLQLSLWRQALLDNSLEPQLRANIAQAGWVRAVVLSESSSPFLEQLAALKPAYAQQFQSFKGATPQDERFAAVFWILHHPEASPQVRAGLSRQTPDGTIDNYRDNWWCNATPQPFPQQSTPQPRFLTPQEKTAATEESKKLQTAGSAPAFLSSVAVSWAQSHPDDPRNPEALALAVKTSRLTCGEFDRSKSIGQAFHLLHERYPGTSWAKSTPYWY